MGGVNGTYFKDKVEFYDAYNSPDYQKILIGLFVDNTTNLKEEWSLNGTYFKDKVEFYNAYNSKDYEKILKQNKKKSKK